MSPESLETVCERIRCQRIDKSWQEQAQARLNSLTKPIGSLGRLEDLAKQFVVGREEGEPAVRSPAVYVFAADHGVASAGVSAYPSEVTAQMVMNFLAGGAAVNVLARAAGVDVKVIDVGVTSDFGPVAGLIERKVARGTQNFSKQAAMTEEQTMTALQVGFEQAREAIAAGRNIVIPGEMGIGNTTAAAALTVALVSASGLEVTGPGTGLATEAVRRKADLVEQAVKKHFGTKRGGALKPLDVLRCVGGLEIAAMVGLILKAASERIIVLLDGFISGAAGAMAAAISPSVKPFLIAAHQSSEPGHARLLQLLGLVPILQLGMRLGEGTGALVAILVLKAALQTYNQMATFESARVSGAHH